MSILLHHFDLIILEGVVAIIVLEYFVSMRKGGRQMLICQKQPLICFWNINFVIQFHYFKSTIVFKCVHISNLSFYMNFHGISKNKSHDTHVITYFTVIIYTWTLRWHGLLKIQLSNVGLVQIRHYHHLMECYV